MALFRVLFVALLFFVGLAVVAKDGRDRWIYAAFALAAVFALLHYHQIPGLSGRRF